MAVVTSKVSDLSGKSGKEAEFVNVVIRSGLGIEKPVQIDALRSEIKELKSAENLVELEVRDNGQNWRVIMTEDDFSKIVKDKDAILASARNVRGRQPKITA
jgi:hypothetical protein